MRWPSWTSRAATVVAVLGLTGLAGLAWWSMLAGERDARRASEDRAAHVADATADAIGDVRRADGDIPAAAALAADLGDVRLAVYDERGVVIGGRAPKSTDTVRAAVPGADWYVEVEVPSAGADVVALGGHAGEAMSLLALVGVGAVAAAAGMWQSRRRAGAELRKTRKRLQEVSGIDDLTGLGNHRRLREDVDALLARGSRYGNGFTVALHLVDAEDPDDRVLRTVASMIEAQARGADRCYRLGRGVVTVLPEQGIAGAAAAGERVRALVASSSMATVSVGVAAYVPWDDQMADDVLNRAAVAARLSVTAGGDRVTATAQETTASS